MTTLRKFIYYLGLLIGLGFFGWQLYKSINSNSIKQLTFINPVLIIISFILMVITFGLQYFNWKVMLIGVGQNLAWLDISKGYSISFVSRYIPGTIWGYVSRSEWMYRNLGVSYFHSGAASFIEIIVTINSAFFIIGLISLISPKIGIFSWASYSLAIPFILSLLIKRLGVIKELSIFKLKTLNPIWKISKKTWISSNIISLAQWIIYGIILWILVISLTDMSYFHGEYFSNIVVAIFVFAFAWVVGFLIPFIPGGLGIREITLSLLLTSIYSLPFEVSSLISITMRILTGAVELFWILFGLFLSTLFQKNSE